MNIDEWKSLKDAMLDWYGEEIEAIHSHSTRKHDLRLSLKKVEYHIYRHPERLAESFMIQINIPTERKDMGDYFNYDIKSLRVAINATKFSTQNALQIRQNFMESNCYPNNELARWVMSLGRSTEGCFDNRFAYCFNPASDCDQITVITVQDNVEYEIYEVAVNARERRNNLEFTITIKLKMSKGPDQNYEYPSGNAATYPKYVLQLNFHFIHDNKCEVFPMNKWLDTQFLQKQFKNKFNKALENAYRKATVKEKSEWKSNNLPWLSVVMGKTKIVYDRGRHRYI